MFDLYYVAANEFEGVYAAWTSRVHPEDIQATAALLEAALRGEAQYDTSFRIVTREGEVRFLRAMASVERDPAGKALHMIGVNYDITEHKLAEQALADQVRHTQAILDNVIDGILTIDERGVVASCNQAAERIFGYAADQVVGNNVKMLMPEPYHSQHDGYLGNYLATDVARVIGIGREVTGLRKDGGTFPMDLAVSEISHHGKRLFVGLVRDITERKRVEQMKSEFVSTVSHESRTPLTSIAGALGLLVGGVLCAMPEAARPMLDIALKNSQRLTHLINDLLDMEKIAAGKLNFDMVVQPLMPLVEQALEANKAYGDQFGVRFELVAREDGAEVRVDSQRLMQVLSNFLSNAAKFSPQGQVVEIDVRREGVKIRVTVCDHGPGIPEEFRSHIFQKFAQADSSDTRQKDGTGLGLAITKELVEQMGGSVGFESIAGQGTRFHFDLPLFDGAAVPAATPGLQNNPDGSRILVVEDDADIAQVLALMLNRAGYRTDIANNGAQALDRLASQSYAAMTLDLMLPDMSGLEVIRRVRQQPATATLPIIVVSAKMEEGRLAFNGDFSALDWLPKPIDRDRLLSAVLNAMPNVDARSVSRPRVLHVEDDADLHSVVRAMAGERFDFEPAATLAVARHRLALERFDLVVLDLSLPDGSGWDLLPLLRQLQPPPRIIILSGSELTAAESASVEASLLKSHVSPRALLDALSERIAKSQDTTGEP